MFRYSRLILPALSITLLAGCISITQRIQSPTQTNREQSSHYFMYRGLKKDIDYINGLAHPPKLASRYDAPGIDWQLLGAIAIFDIPFSTLFDTAALPFDVGKYDESLPEESIADYFGGFSDVELIRVYKVYDGNIRAKGTLVYENTNPNLLRRIDEALKGIASTGSVHTAMNDEMLDYRIELVNARRMITLEIKDNYLIAPKESFNPYYGETYGRECLLRRIAENIDLFEGTIEIQNPALTR